MGGLNEKRVPQMRQQISLPDIISKHFRCVNSALLKTALRLFFKFPGTAVDTTRKWTL